MALGTERFYKPGSFYRICDRTGMAVRAERTSTEWNNLIVSDRVYERRHPQDFVKGVPDNQSVPFARPRQPNTFIKSGAVSQITVYGDLPGRVCFEAIGGQFQCFGGTVAPVDPSKFPSGF